MIMADKNKCAGKYGYSLIMQAPFPPFERKMVSCRCKMAPILAADDSAPYPGSAPCPGQPAQGPKPMPPTQGGIPSPPVPVQPAPVQPQHPGMSVHGTVTGRTKTGVLPPQYHQVPKPRPMAGCFVRSSTYPKFLAVDRLSDPLNQAFPTDRFLLIADGNGTLVKDRKFIPFIKTHNDFHSHDLYFCSERAEAIDMLELNNPLLSKTHFLACIVDVYTKAFNAFTKAYNKPSKASMAVDWSVEMFNGEDCQVDLYKEATLAPQCHDDTEYDGSKILDITKSMF